MADIVENLISEYSKKSYTKLLTLPEHFQLNLPALETLKQTIEFVRILYDDCTLKIVFRHVYWQTQEQVLEKYTQQYLLMGLTAKGAEKKAAKTLHKVLGNGLDTSGQDLPKSAIAAMQQMKIEHRETAFPYLRPKYAPDLIFNQASLSDYFIKKEDDSFKTVQDVIDESMALEINTIEKAPWFGKTGLGEETERELPRYLRLEFGETLSDQGALKARSIKYLGVFALTKPFLDSPNTPFDESATSVHIWQIGKGEKYAYIEILANGDHIMHMGNYFPPKTK